MAGRAVHDQAAEVITQVHTTQRTININIFNIDLSNSTIIQNLTLNIKRLGASAFAVKFQVDKGVVFEGTIRFLSEGVDKIMAELKKLASALRSTFDSAIELVSALAPPNPDRHEVCEACWRSAEGGLYSSGVAERGPIQPQEIRAISCAAMWHYAQRRHGSARRSSGYDTAGQSVRPDASSNPRQRGYSLRCRSGRRPLSVRHTGRIDGGCRADGR